eukprot:TRINITY_DN3450_c0_g1_i2.p1 TRINITY_DN3450_c0_g1~~TRINITY_DN3450_c0_g1_i2.p1  ORF type:complete len:167 (+),score=17.77 TRINITY_DN3450_c0_g1_i2:33-503(+)
MGDAEYIINRVGSSLSDVKTVLDKHFHEKYTIREAVDQLIRHDSTVFIDALLEQCPFDKVEQRQWSKSVFCLLRHVDSTSSRVLLADVTEKYDLNMSLTRGAARWLENRGLLLCSVCYTHAEFRKISHRGAFAIARSDIGVKRFLSENGIDNMLSL